jgi:hypothetical protein
MEECPLQLMVGLVSQCISPGNQFISQKLLCLREFRVTGGKQRKLRFRPSTKEVGPKVGL